MGLYCRHGQIYIYIYYIYIFSYQALRPNLDLFVFQSSKYRVFFSLRQSSIILPNSRMFSDISANPRNVHRAIFNYLYCHLYPDLAYNFTRQRMYLLKSLCEECNRNFLNATLLPDLLLQYKSKKNAEERSSLKCICVLHCKPQMQVALHHIYMLQYLQLNITLMFLPIRSKS